MEEKDGTSPMNKNVDPASQVRYGNAVSADRGHCGQYCADDIFRGSYLSEQQYPGRYLCDGRHPDPVCSLCGTGRSEGDQPQRSTCSGFVRKVLRNPQ